MYAWIIGASLLLVLIGGAFAGYYYLYNPRLTQQEQNNQNTTSSRQTIEGWRTYQNDVLGIAFQYPPEWGEPELSPNNYVTDLGSVLDKYEKQGANNAYSTSMELRFPKEYTPRIAFMNNTHQGEHYKNAQTYNLGYIDNFSMLKDTGNICDYKINFDHRPIWDGTLEEIYSECARGVKMYLVKDTEYFDDVKYSYSLHYAGFIKLKNGFFNDVIISQRDGWIVQVPNSSLTFNEFVNWKSEAIPKAIPYQNKRNIFEKFSSTIIAFEPPTPKPLILENIPNEAPAHTRIRGYYFHIANQNPESARQFRGPNETNAEDITIEYGNIYTLAVTDINQLSTNQYEVFLDVQNQNAKPRQVRELITISKNSQLQIDLSETIRESILYQGDKTAYIANRGEQNYLILKDGESEFVIDEAPDVYKFNNSSINNISEVRYFKNLRASPNGRYLVYDAGGWEWSNTFVYDAQTRERKTEFGFGQYTAFSGNENFFMACGNGYGPSVGKLYHLPEFEIRYDVLAQNFAEGYESIRCELDNENANFTLSEKYNTETQKIDTTSMYVKYNITTGEYSTKKATEEATEEKQ